MALHVALLEPLPTATSEAIARQCAAADASLHVVGPLPDPADDAALRAVTVDDTHRVDLWIHPGWRAFRDAMSRERCLYFALDGERDAAEAPFRANSVLVIGNAEGILPERILHKYPDRIYRLPQPPRKRAIDLGASVELLLAVAAKGVTTATERASGGVEVKPAPPVRFGRR